jgi:endonuclease/exonuclease/phosphatase family metal-dependent hydrolase
MDADVLALQEVENLHVLDRFNSKYLRSEGYKYRILIDGFDRRKIDVALLSRYPIKHIKTHREERSANKRSFVFSRDCLVCDVDINGEDLRLYVNHFKSMIGGRARTKARRKAQVKKVVEIIDADWNEFNYDGNYMVLGDFNDYPGVGTALNALIKNPRLEDVMKRIRLTKDRWTHYWASGNQYSQLDYILLSKNLASRDPDKEPEIFRQGLPYRAENYFGKRIKGVGKNSPKASDHAGLVMEVKLK